MERRQTHWHCLHITRFSRVPVSLQYPVVRIFLWIRSLAAVFIILHPDRSAARPRHSSRSGSAVLRGYLSQRAPVAHEAFYRRSRCRTYFIERLLAACLMRSATACGCET